MRFLIGVIFGVILTIGAAYVHDNVNFGREARAVARPMIVNWDVLTGLWSATVERPAARSFGQNNSGG
ncbi:hypothetical protein [Blastochloris viridis]|uniref:Uncharacterized protein n=1 Tax=Blastochloris viridis TaxID=1079 RepID=A0A0H5BAH0_BLAVI|nr:hypothetical protein [Blastochloris viridis]ALK10776.1 hypothetical protein BVIR_3015 [Blastochloris viridis]BAR99257.1 hypothetical protein BV133_1664 [Blastochloris viridis]CUU43438.1 hypothetical protein BVIRIDIS_24590 [Blastochloris viridis]